MSTDSAARLVALLTERGEVLATAESCTGGLISAAITAVPGSSEVHWGGIISYANDAKIGLLEVDPVLLAREGAVSGAVAKSMAWGVRNLSGADWTVSVTGIAGPGGGSREKPVGTVWIGWSDPGGSVRARQFRFNGDRDSVREAAVGAAIAGILESIDSDGGETTLDR